MKLRTIYFRIAQNVRLQIFTFLIYCFFFVLFFKTQKTMCVDSPRIRSVVTSLSSFLLLLCCFYFEHLARCLAFIYCHYRSPLSLSQFAKIVCLLFCGVCQQTVNNSDDHDGDASEVSSFKLERLNLKSDAIFTIYFRIWP